LEVFHHPYQFQPMEQKLLEVKQDLLEQYTNQTNTFSKDPLIFLKSSKQLQEKLVLKQYHMIHKLFPNQISTSSVPAMPSDNIPHN
jgi:hypothetical protein